MSDTNAVMLLGKCKSSVNLLLLEVKPEELRPWQWPREYSTLLARTGLTSNLETLATSGAVLLVRSTRWH